MTFVSETGEPPESEDKDRAPGLPELSYPSPEESSQLTPLNVAESVPSDIFLDSTPSPGHGPIDASALSLREAFLLRSYIQKIAAVVSYFSSSGK